MENRNLILILTEEVDSHADAMVDVLHERAPEVEVVRFHPALFPEAAQMETHLSAKGFSAWLHFYHRSVDLTRVRSVWVRKPQKPRLTDRISEAYRAWSQAETEEALAGLWRSLGAFVVNPPQANKEASHKLSHLHTAQQLGFTIAPTLVSNIPEAARSFHAEQDGDVIIKALSSPLVAETEQEYRVLYTQPVHSDALDGPNGERIRHVPVQLQRLVRKQVELRVTVIDDQVFTAALQTDSRQIDIRRWQETSPAFSVHTLPKHVEQRCIALTRRLGLYYGAIDLLVTPEGEYIFLEINPAGQFYWIEQATGLPMMAAMADLLVHPDRTRRRDPACSMT